VQHWCKPWPASQLEATLFADDSVVATNCRTSAWVLLIISLVGQYKMIMRLHAALQVVQLSLWQSLIKRTCHHNPLWNFFGKFLSPTPIPGTSLIAVLNTENISFLERSVRITSNLQLINHNIYSVSFKWKYIWPLILFSKLYGKLQFPKGICLIAIEVTHLRRKNKHMRP